MYDLVTKVVKEEEEKQLKLSAEDPYEMGGDKPFLISLLGCLYEAEDSSLCEFVADLLHHSLSLPGYKLTPLDCLSIGYFLSVVSTTVSGVFTVDLEACSIGDQGCKFLLRGFSKHPNTHSEITSQLDVDISTNDIYTEGAQHIAQLLKNTREINKLNLSRNPIGEDGLKSLCDALSTSTTVEVLELRDCSLTLNEENISQLLSINNYLITLDLSDNVVTDCHHIAAGLSNNQTLRTLRLNRCNLTDQSIQDLSTGLNNFIEELDIGGNKSITETGLRIGLTTLSGMRRLVIPYHLKSSIDTVFSEANEERRKNGLPEIKVKGE